MTENDSQQNVVQMKVAKCHLFGYLTQLVAKHRVSSFVHVGQINIDVPLRPMVVHGVVYRESKVIEQNILPEIKNFVIFETPANSSGAAADGNVSANSGNEESANDANAASDLIGASIKIPTVPGSRATNSRFSTLEGLNRGGLKAAVNLMPNGDENGFDSNDYAVYDVNENKVSHFWIVFSFY